MIGVATIRVLTIEDTPNATLPDTGGPAYDLESHSTVGAFRATERPCATSTGS
jgi:hypothetical protein